MRDELVRPPPRFSVRRQSLDLVGRERRQREADCHFHIPLDLDPTVHEGVLGIDLAAAKLRVDRLVESNRRARFGRRCFDSERGKEHEAACPEAFENEASVEFS